MAARFEGTDFYDIDALLSEEERMVRDTIREWVEDRVIPIIGDAYVERRFPTELIPEIGELGMLGANLPAEHGCAELNNVCYGLIMQELERGDSGVRSFVSVQGALVMYPIYAFGSEEQRREWLPGLASGEKIGCFGLTEPDYGSNPVGMITRARETADGWVLNGTKMWITKRVDGGCGGGVGADGGGGGTRGAFGDSSCRRTRPDSAPATRRASCRCWRRTPANWCWRTWSCLPMR